MLQHYQLVSAGLMLDAAARAQVLIFSALMQAVTNFPLSHYTDELAGPSEASALPHFPVSSELADNLEEPCPPKRQRPSSYSPGLSRSTSTSMVSSMDPPAFQPDFVDCMVPVAMAGHPQSDIYNDDFKDLLDWLDNVEIATPPAQPHDQTFEYRAGITSNIDEVS